MIDEILKKKNAEIDKLLSRFDGEWEKLSRELKRTLGPLLKAGVPTQEDIMPLLGDIDTLVQKTVDEYNGLIGFAKDAADEMGIKFLVTERSLALLELAQEHAVFKSITNKNHIVNNMIDAGLQAEVENLKYRDIVKNLEELITETGRRIKAEVHTGLSVFDRMIKSENFKNVGIEKFVYVGPYDGVTRDVCRNTLESSLQGTGWTRDQIESSEVSFTGGGGYNCRHEWLPFVEEIKEAFVYGRTDQFERED